jgi:hypothetical protein
MDTSTWVPLVTAAAGLAAGLATGLGSTVLARRWASEDRQAAWQREDRLRWQADRLQIYARLVSALEAWQAEIRRLQGADKDAEPFDAAEWERHVDAVQELRSLVFLTAPQKVRDLAEECPAAFVVTGVRLEKAGDPGDDPDAWRQPPLGMATWRATRRLAEAMRADLGLGGDGPPAARRPDASGRSGGSAHLKSARKRRPPQQGVISRTGQQHHPGGAEDGG